MMIHVAWYRFPTQSDGPSASWGDSDAAVAVAAWFSTLQKRGLQSYALIRGNDLILPHVADLFVMPAHLLTDRCNGKSEKCWKFDPRSQQMGLPWNNQPTMQVASTFSTETHFKLDPSDPRNILQVNEVGKHKSLYYRMLRYMLSCFTSYTSYFSEQGCITYVET